MEPLAGLHFKGVLLPPSLAYKYWARFRVEVGENDKPSSLLRKGFGSLKVLECSPLGE